jgi:hypothetical protein
MHLYQLLRKCWDQARIIWNHPNRDALQRDLEKNYCGILNLFDPELGIAVPFCKNHSARSVSGVWTPELQRQLSQTTRTLNSEWPKVVFERSSPNVKFVRMPKVPDGMTALYEGRYDPERGKVVREMEGIVAAEDGPRRLVIAQRRTDGYWLVYGDMMVRTSLTRGFAALAVSGDVALVAGERLIERFKLEPFELVDRIDAPKEILGACALTVWRDLIILGIGGSLYAWTVNLGSSILSTTIQCTPEIDPITSLCGVGDFLAVAGVQHPVVHVYALSGSSLTVVRRLIGHTAGITCLRSGSGGRLFTGSLDTTVQVWTMWGGLESCFDRQGGEVIAICPAPGGCHLMFTAARDSTVRAWDLGQERGAWELKVGEGARPLALHFDPGGLQLIVLVALEEDIPTKGQLQMYSFA